MRHRNAVNPLPVRLSLPPTCASLSPSPPAPLSLSLSVAQSVSLLVPVERLAATFEARFMRHIMRIPWATSARES